MHSTCTRGSSVVERSAVAENDCSWKVVIVQIETDKSPVQLWPAGLHQNQWPAKSFMAHSRPIPAIINTKLIVAFRISFSLCISGTRSEAAM